MRGGRDAQEPLEEAIPTALEYIDEHGSLVRFVPDRPQRLALMKAMAGQALVVWNKTAAKYELTALGRASLAEYHKKIALGRVRAIAHKPETRRVGLFRE